MASGIDNCQYARQRHQNLLRWRNLWTILLFVFGAAIVVVLVLTIAFVTDGKYVETAASTLGTVASGVAIRWVVDRRNDAKLEEEEAWKEARELCKDVASDFAPEADLRSKYRLFGRWL